MTTVLGKLRKTTSKGRHDTENIDQRTRTKIKVLYLKNHKKYL